MPAADLATPRNDHAPANAAALAESQERLRAYRPDEHEQVVTGMIDVFGPEFFARFAGAGLESRRPVFIFGMPR